MGNSSLRKIGLSESQAKGYVALIEHGALTPAGLAQKIQETRTNAYAICDKLEELGLASKTTGTKTTYIAESPTKLKQLLIRQQESLKAASNELTGLLPGLLSRYRLTSDRPGVLYLDGIESLRLIFDDIIRNGQTVHVIPSAFDNDSQEVASMIASQITRQRKAGIKTCSLIRRENFPEFSRLQDELFEARPADFEPLEAQIIIYGDNIAITTFRTGVVSTVVTSPLIAQTFEQLFQALWQSTDEVDTKID